MSETYTTPGFMKTPEEQDQEKRKRRKEQKENRELIRWFDRNRSNPRLKDHFIQSVCDLEMPILEALQVAKDDFGELK